MHRLATFTLLFCLAGCSGPASKKEHAGHDEKKSLYDKVMDVHDKVMPRMDELQKLKRKLQETLNNSKELTTEKRLDLERKVKLLDSASRSMMNWMYEFKPEEFKGDSLKIYLEKEMQRINQVKNLILQAIRQASDS